jgi:SulP family sulfate permease
MVTPEPAQVLPLTEAREGGLGRYLPFLEWLPRYRRQDLVGDLMASVIVAVMLVPQGMAYALLAGLPPQVGLYAGILPLILYGLLGSSPYLGVGPVAIVSLLVASGIGKLAPQDSAGYWGLALALALLVGIIQIAMGLVRVGFLLNILSHPVLAGFTSAAAVVIGFSQLKHLLGITLPSAHSLHELLIDAVRHGRETNLVTVSIGLGSMAILLYFRNALGGQLQRVGLPAALHQPITRSGPLVAVALSTLLVWAFGLHETAGVKVVGEIPAGLPPLTVPPLEPGRWQALLPTALTISFVGFLESISVAKSLASKRRQKVDANQELVALGVANLGAAFTGGYPVTGSFSRSVVSFTAGGNTGLALIITALLIALTVAFLMPLLYFLPQAVLAAVIIAAVYNLIDISTVRRVWCYNKADLASLLATFVAVLELGVETGVVVGIIASLLLYVWRTSQPQVVVVGRVGDTPYFRNVLHHQVRTYPEVLAVRVDESLYFANAKRVADLLRCAAADHPSIKHMVLICSGINFIDISALETLENLIHELRDAGITLHLAEVKWAVMERLENIGFTKNLGDGRVFASTHQAIEALTAKPETGSAVPTPTPTTPSGGQQRVP